MQSKQSEWNEQWQIFKDDERFLFNEWIAPVTLEDFRSKDVLDAGCGGGQHTYFVAPYARQVTAVDLNTPEIARERNRANANVTYVEADIAAMDLKKQFDIVYSIGVVHHTDDPDATVENLKRHVKPGGKLILWVYSREGNFLVRAIVEPVKRFLLGGMTRAALLRLSRIVTALLYPPVYTLYLLPLPFLPYYEYFSNFRRMSFERNLLNVFDKLNAPQTHFISLDRARSWLSGEFARGSVKPYKGVSYTVIAERGEGA